MDFPCRSKSLFLSLIHIFKILKMNNKSVDLVELIYEEPSIMDNIAEEIGEA